jgi:hypothetical protein
MGFFGFLFWMVVIWLAVKTWRRWQRERWVTAGPGRYGRYSGWYDSSEFYRPRSWGIEVKGREKLPNQQEYIDSLETRVSELEERLDFTERLLAERRESATSS